jgi:hypothetical protein
MTNEDILEGNILIAKFMGCTQNKHGFVSPKGTKYTFPKKNNDAVSIHWLRYHLDWDWVMPVAKKCIKIYHDERGDIFQALTSSEDDVTTLFQAIVKFITWYNDPETPWCVCNGYPKPEHKLYTR